MQQIAWPPSYHEERLRRLRLWEKLGDAETLAKADRFYKTHPAEWINDFCITFDPRIPPPAQRLIPFVLFRRQREFIQFLHFCWKTKTHGLVEKSRDIGATWLACAFSVWLWKYWDGSVIGWGSLLAHNIDDRGNPKAIFLKIRQLIANLPAFMVPEGYYEKIHAPSMKILHPYGSAAIIGEGGDNMGRGGRTTIYIKDESAHYEHPDLVEAALGDNTDVQLDISSVNGPANIFYRRRMAGELWIPGNTPTPGKVQVFVFDWRDHPGKTQAWYETRRKKAEEEGLLHVFAQEVDRDYSGSVDKVIIPGEWVRAAVDAHIKLGFKDDGEKVAGQDVADGGGDKNALACRTGVVLRYCDDWGGEAGDAARRALPICAEMGMREVYYDSIGVGAGFKDGAKTMALPGIKVLPWNGGAEVVDPDKHIVPTDHQSPLNKDQYLNLKAQGWFRLRARFYKTFRAVNHGEKFSPAELISLDSTMPKIHELQMQLSQAIYGHNEKGKTKVDKKPNGALSPNLADAVVICYNPVRPPMGFFSV